MQRSKFTDAQIAFVLQEAEEGTSVFEVSQKAGIAEATFYKWRKKYGGLMPLEIRRLKQLEEENNKLKRLVADLRAVWDVSIRRTCRVLCAPRSSHHYRTRSGDQADLKKRIKEIAQTRSRYGYRHIHIFLRREGREVNPNRIYFGALLSDKLQHTALHGPEDLPVV